MLFASIRNDSKNTYTKFCHPPTPWENPPNLLMFKCFSFLGIDGAQREEDEKRTEQNMRKHRQMQTMDKAEEKRGRARARERERDTYIYIYIWL